MAYPRGIAREVMSATDASKNLHASSRSKQQRFFTELKRKTILMRMNNFQARSIGRVPEHAYLRRGHCTLFSTLVSIVDRSCMAVLELRVSIYPPPGTFNPRKAHDRVRLSLSLSLIGETHNFNTRQKENLKLKKCRTTAAQKCTTYAGFDMYNKVPNEIKDAENFIHAVHADISLISFPSC